MYKFLAFMCMTMLSCTSLNAICAQDIQDIENYCVMQMQLVRVEIKNKKQSDFTKFECYAEGKIQAYSEIRILCELLKNKNNLSMKQRIKNE